MANPVETSIPWEKRKELGFFHAFLNTLGAQFFHTREFFSDFKEGGLGKAILFFWLCTLPLLLLSFGVFYVYTDALPVGAKASIGWEALGIVGVCALGFTLALFVLEILGSAWLHLWLRLRKAATRGFSATFKVALYSSSFQIWALIPFLGTIVSAIWGLVFVTYGLHRVHQVPLSRVIWSYLWASLSLGLLALGSVFLVSLIRSL